MANDDLQRYRHKSARKVLNRMSNLGALAKLKSAPNA